MAVTVGFELFPDPISGTDFEGSIPSFRGSRHVWVRLRATVSVVAFTHPVTHVTHDPRARIGRN